MPIDILLQQREPYMLKEKNKNERRKAIDDLYVRRDTSVLKSRGRITSLF